jgi:hypothetical protein
LVSVTTKANMTHQVTRARGAGVEKTLPYFQPDQTVGSSHLAPQPLE